LKPSRPESEAERRIVARDNHALSHRFVDRAMTVASAAIVSFSDLPAAPEIDYPRPERLVRGNPRRQTWNVFTDAGGQMRCGLWSCEPGAWRIAFAADKDEFFHVIQGRVRLHDEHGRIVEIGPGEAAVIPAGFTGVFEVVEAVRKHYVVVERHPS
jgi:uncharacterized cupin superfamily protein